MEVRKLANPLVLLDDARLGLELWGAKRHLRVTDDNPDQENSFWALNNQLFFGFLRRLFPNVRIIDAKTTTPAITKRVKDFSAELDAVPVFLDKIIGSGHSEFLTSRLDICRTTNKTGDDLGLDNRPGTANIQDQVIKLKAALKNKRYKGVLLVDDVVGPHAATVQKIISLLKEYSIPVSGVLAEAVFAGSHLALDKLNLPLVAMYDHVEEGGDILNTADLYPFHPYGGLKGKEIVYEPGPNLRSVSFPYVPPFFPRSLFNRELFVIPKEREKDFGIVSLASSLRLFQHLRQMCGRDITLGDLDSPAFIPTFNPRRPVEQEIAKYIHFLGSENFMGLSSEV